MTEGSESATENNDGMERQLLDKGEKLQGHLYNRKQSQKGVEVSFGSQAGHKLETTMDEEIHVSNHTDSNYLMRFRG